MSKQSTSPAVSTVFDIFDFAQRDDFVSSLGVDPWEDEDTAFGVEMVYCGQHMRAHGVGWCSVRPGEKIPLSTRKSDENYHEAAQNEARALGLAIYGDPRTCNNCGNVFGFNDNANGRCPKGAKHNSYAHVFTQRRW